MAALESSNLHEVSCVETRSGKQVTAVFHVSVTVSSTEAPAPQDVIAIAQGAESGDKVPRIGDTFDFLATVGASDAFIECDSITARQRIPGPESRLKWRVTCVYKSPELRNNSVDPEVGVSPEQREARFWVENRYVNVPRDRGRNVQPIKFPYKKENSRDEDPPVPRPADTDGPVTNAAGHRYGAVPTRRIQLPTFVYKKNVLNPFSFINVVRDFRDSVNAEEWNVFGTGQLVSAEFCLFNSIEISRPQYWGESLIYFELECRVDYNPDGHLIEVRNEGAMAWRQYVNDPDVGNAWFLEIPKLAGEPMQAPIPLDLDGQAASWSTGGDPDFPEPDANDLFIQFDDLKRADFDALNTRLSELV